MSARLEALAALAGAAPSRVLIVDDDPQQRMLATEILEAPAYEVEAVGDGAARTSTSSCSISTCRR
jgi:CheY-like chemotaxis protein